MNIRIADRYDIDIIAPSIAEFRVYLKSLHGIKAKPNIEAAREEFIEYIDNSFAVYAALNELETVAGYIVLRESCKVIWVESLYVDPEFRRQGVATLLFETAEEYTETLGNDCVYNWIHPNDDIIINFLKNRGYNTLNLIELTKDRDKKDTEVITVGNHTYKYKAN